MSESTIETTKESSLEWGQELELNYEGLNYPIKLKFLSNGDKPCLSFNIGPVTREFNEPCPIGYVNNELELSIIIGEILVFTKEGGKLITYSEPKRQTLDDIQKQNGKLP